MQSTSNPQSLLPQIPLIFVSKFLCQSTRENKQFGIHRCSRGWENTCESCLSQKSSTATTQHSKALPRIDVNSRCDFNHNFVLTLPVTIRFRSRLQQNRRCCNGGRRWSILLRPMCSRCGSLYLESLSTLFIDLRCADPRYQTLFRDAEFHGRRAHCLHFHVDQQGVAKSSEPANSCVANSSSPALSCEV